MRTIALALATMVLMGSVGCTSAQWQKIQRQRKYPPDYDPTPLGRQYETPAKAEKLTHPDLRGWMKEWFKHRDLYLEKWREHGIGPILEAWRKRDVLFGKRVRVESGQEGTADGVDETGGLRVRIGNDVQVVRAGQVTPVVHASG